MRGEGRAAGAAAIVLVLTIVVVALGGCAHRGVGVPVESRPTPPQPTAGAPETPPRSATAKASAPVAGTGLKTRMSRAAADTAAASMALRKCAGKNLLPDQESVYESTLRLLVEARAAMASEDWSRAESSARQARQLAASLSCY